MNSFLTCVFMLRIPLLDSFCAHLNICNDKYSWFSYFMRTLGQFMARSGKWTWGFILMGPTLKRSPLCKGLVVIFIRTEGIPAQPPASSRQSLGPSSLISSSQNHLNGSICCVSKRPQKEIWFCKTATEG